MRVCRVILALLVRHVEPDHAAPIASDDASTRVEARFMAAPYACPDLNGSVVGRALYMAAMGATALRWQVAFWSSAFRWLVGPVVRPLMRPSHAPLAIMPFARVRSRP